MINELIERLKECPDNSCSRCGYYGTPACAVKEAIEELKQFDQTCYVLNEVLATHGK